MKISSLNQSYRSTSKPVALQAQAQRPANDTQQDKADLSHFPDNPELWETHKSSPSLLAGDPMSSTKVKLGRFNWSRVVHPDGKQEDNRKDVTIDFSKVKKVHFITEPFAPTVIAGHSYLAFEMEPGGVVGPKGEESDAFVVSMEAWKHKGDSYGLLKGMQKKFKVSMEVGTWDDQCDKVLDNTRSEEFLRAYPLRLNREDAQKVARTAIDEAIKQDSNEWYHTLSNSCHTRAWELLEKSLGKGAVASRRRLGIIPKLLPLLPGTVGPVLDQSGLLAGPPVLVANEHSAPKIEKAKASWLNKIMKKPGAVLVSVMAGTLGGTFAGGLLGARIGAFLSPAIGSSVGAILGGSLGGISGADIGFGVGRHLQLLGQGTIVNGQIYSDLSDLSEQAKESVTQ